MQAHASSRLNDPEHMSLVLMSHCCMPSGVAAAVTLTLFHSSQLCPFHTICYLLVCKHFNLYAALHDICLQINDQSCVAVKATGGVTTVIINFENPPPSRPFFLMADILTCGESTGVTTNIYDGMWVSHAREPLINNARGKRTDSQYYLMLPSVKADAVRHVCLQHRCHSYIQHCILKKSLAWN